MQQIDFQSMINDCLQKNELVNASHLLETLLIISPQNNAVRLMLAQVYIAMKENLYRARARILLETYMSSESEPSSSAIESLIKNVYFTHGPIDKIPELLNGHGHKLNPQLLQTFHAQFIAENEAYSHPQDAEVKKNVISKLPSSIGDFSEIRRSIREFVLAGHHKTALLREGSVFTFGSCFATNVARVLKEKSYPVASFHVGEEVNTTFSNLNLIKYIAGINTPHQEYYRAILGDKKIDSLLGELSNSTAIIYTMGVASGFFEIDSKFFIPHTQHSLRSLLKRQDVKYRFSTIEENINALEEMLALLKARTKIRHMFITVSPVPLAASIGMNSVIEADTESKSILRAAAGIFSRANPGFVSYFPSFEVLRWLPCFRNESAFGLDDGTVRHPNLEYVREIVDAFIDLHG